MRQQPLIWSIVTFALLAHPVEAQNRYVGVKTCARCHDTAGQGSALHRWQTSKHAEAFRAGTRDHDVRATPGRCGYYLLDAGITSSVEFCENGANTMSWRQPAGVCAIPHRLAHLAQ